MDDSALEASSAKVLWLAAEFFREKDGIRNLAHRLSALAAFALHPLISLFFAELEIMLQDELGAVDCFSRLQSSGKLSVF